MVATVLNTWNASANNVTSITVNVGTIKRYNSLIAIISLSNSTAISSSPSGWALVDSENISATARIEIWKKEATSSESANYIWSGVSADYIASIYEIDRGDIDSVSVPFTHTETSTSPNIPQQDETVRPAASLRIIGFLSQGNAGSTSLASGHTEVDNETTGGTNIISFISGWVHHLNKYFSYASAVSKKYRVSEFITETHGANIALSGNALHMVVTELFHNFGSTKHRIYSYKRNSLTSNWQSSSTTLDGDPENSGFSYDDDLLELSNDGLTLVVLGHNIGQPPYKIITFTRITATDNWVHQASANTLFDVFTGITISGDALQLAQSILHTNKPTIINLYSRTSVSSSFIKYNTFSFKDISAHYPYFSNDGLRLQVLNFNAAVNSVMLSRKEDKSIFAQPEVSYLVNINHGRFVSDNGYLVGGRRYLPTKHSLRAIDPLTLAVTTPTEFTNPSHGSPEELSPGGWFFGGGPKGDCVSMAGVSRTGADGDPGDLKYWVNVFNAYLPEITHAAANSVPNLAFYIDIKEKIYSGVNVYPDKVDTEVAGDKEVYLGPIAVQDNYEAQEDGTLITIPAPGVLSNDEYIE